MGTIFNEAPDLDGASKALSSDFIGNVSATHEESNKSGIVFIVISQQATSRSLSKSQLRRITYREEVERVRQKFITKGAVSRYELFFLIHGTMMEDLEEWAASGNMPFVDGIAALDHDRDALLTWIHLSPRGNRIVAEALSEEILTHTCPGTP